MIDKVEYEKKFRQKLAKKIRSEVKTEKRVQGLKILLNNLQEVKTKIDMYNQFMLDCDGFDAEVKLNNLISEVEAELYLENDDLTDFDAYLEHELPEYLVNMSD